MNNFFYKKPYRRWTWKSPDGKTRNEIDYFITDKRHIFKDVTVLNKFATASDHRMVRATIEIQTSGERYKMIKRKRARVWTQSRNDKQFEDYISKALHDKPTTNDTNRLNDIIVSTITEAQNKFCPASAKEQKISPETKQKIEERRALKSDKNTNQQTINTMNKEISKAIRQDIRKYKSEKIIQTIEENKSMKIMRRKCSNGRKEIFKLKDETGKITTNREELLHIVERFYETLYTNQSTFDPIEYLQRKVKNQGSEDIPDISIDEIYNALKKMKNNKVPGEDGVVTEAGK